jgi:hypothetical protein
MFDIYFSLVHGFEIDFPFLSFWIPTQTVAFLIIAFVALRIRKVYFLDNKRGRK